MKNPNNLPLNFKGVPYKAHEKLLNTVYPSGIKILRFDHWGKEPGNKRAAYFECLCPLCGIKFIIKGRRIKGVKSCRCKGLNIYWQAKNIKRNGTMPITSKLTSPDVAEIIKLSNMGYSVAKLSSIFQISEIDVEEIIKFKPNRKPK